MSQPELEIGCLLTVEQGDGYGVTCGLPNGHDGDHDLRPYTDGPPGVRTVFPEVSG